MGKGVPKEGVGRRVWEVQGDGMAMEGGRF